MNNIKFNFTIMNFDYILPLTGVDHEFIKERRAEIQFCTFKLKEKIQTLDITTKEGVADFDIASKLVKYYFNAWLLLSHKEEVLLSGNRKENAEQAIKHNKKWSHNNHG